MAEVDRREALIAEWPPYHTHEQPLEYHRSIAQKKKKEEYCNAGAVVCLGSLVVMDSVSIFMYISKHTRFSMYRIECVWPPGHPRIFDCRNHIDVIIYIYI